MQEAGIKLSIREDKEAGVIRAFFAPNNPNDKRAARREVATLSREIAEACPGLFEEWVKTLSAALAMTIQEATGMEVAGFNNTIRGPGGAIDTPPQKGTATYRRADS